MGDEVKYDRQVVARENNSSLFGGLRKLRAWFLGSASIRFLHFIFFVPFIFFLFSNQDNKINRVSFRCNFKTTKGGEITIGKSQQS